MKLIAPILIAALLLSSCQNSTIITTLDAAVAAAEVVIPLIGPAAGLSPQITALITTYLQAVLTGTSQASTILAGPGTSEQKAAQILQLFSKISQGIVLPAGTPGVVQAVVAGVMQAVAVFLSNVRNPAPSSPAKVPGMAKLKLSAIRARSEAGLSKLSTIRR